jgi:hypothetical protein
MTELTGDEGLDVRGVKPSSVRAGHSRRAVPHPGREARAKSGKDARRAAPLDSQPTWSPTIARIPSNCWKVRLRPGSLSWCRFGTGG